MPPPSGRWMRTLWLPGVALLLVGCVTPPSLRKGNPSFNVSTSDAGAVLREMRENPKPLQRPLVVLSGFCDPGIAANILCGEFKRLTGDDRVIGVSFLFCGNFQQCRRNVIEAVDKAFPNDDPQWTTEVDVVGVSMGGLVGRYAAALEPDHPDARRLRVARLFTISSPHRGAALAMLPTLSRLQLDMRADSEFLHRLTRAESAEGDRDANADNNAAKPAGYTLVPYVRLGDTIVGAKNAAPDGTTPWWLPAEPFQDSHLMAMVDPRIIADVARRLRGESPLTHDPPQPLPTPS
jgi:pimeloyl-ACP methyl ester carboxylesterase